MSKEKCLNRSAKEFYSETEAAAALNVSIARLRRLLDQYIFTDGAQRPPFIEFTSGDLLLLGYWNQNSKTSVSNTVIEMPKRG